MEQILFSPPDIREEDIAAVCEVLRSGWITTGPKTRAFEAALCDYTGAEACVCMNSATAALEMTLRLLGVGKGDEVITSAYTYTASASVIEHVGATPVLLDIQKDKPFVSADALESAINKKTKAIILVDIAGVMADYDAARKAIAAKAHLFTPATPLQEAMGRVALISDAAHSLGAVSMGTRSGRAADFTSFSFHAVKNLTTAEGGALTFSSFENFSAAEMEKTLRLLILHGQTKDALKKSRAGDWEYDIMLPAFKCNMTDISAAMGLSQLARYESSLARRHEILAAYEDGLSDKPVTFLSQVGDNWRGSAHLAISRVTGVDVQTRNKLIVAMGEQGVACNVHYKPLPLLTAYANMGFSPADYPNAMAFYENEITLPLHTLLRDDQVSYVIDAYRRLV